MAEGEPPDKSRSDEPASGTAENGAPNSEAYKKVAHGAILVLIGNVAGLTLGFLARAVPARLLGPEGYGLIVLGFTVASTLSILAKMGLPAGVARNLPRFGELEDRRGIVVSSVSLTLTFSLAVAAAVFVSAEVIAVRIFDEPGLTGIIRVFSLTIPVIPLKSIMVSTFRGLKRAKENVLVNNVLTPGLRLLLVTAAIIAGFGVLGAAAGWVAGSVLTATFATYLLYRETSLLDRGRFRTHYRMLLAFSLPLMISSAIAPVLSYGDNFLLGYFMTSADVGVYDATFTVGKLVITALSAFGILFMPVFSELHAAGDIGEMKRLYKVVTKWIVSFTLPVFLVIVLFPSTLLTFLFGGEYAAGSLPLIIISSGFFVRILVGLCDQALVSMGYTRFVMWGNLATAGLNIALNVALIPVLGIIGAAAASALSYAAFNALYTYRLYRDTGISPFSPSLIRPLLYASFSILLVQALARTLLDIRLWMLPLFFGVFVALYALAFMRFGGVQREDVEIVMAIERRTGIDLSYAKKVLNRFV